MKLVSFLGFFVSASIYGLTWSLSIQRCYRWDCQCQFNIVSQDLYVFISLFLATFFLLYSVVILFKLIEVDALKTEKYSSKEIKSDLNQKHYNIYKLPMVKVLTIMCLVFSLGTSFFGLILSHTGCQLVEGVRNCKLAECVDPPSMGQEIYIGGYAMAAAYFVSLSMRGLYKIYKS